MKAILPIVLPSLLVGCASASSQGTARASRARPISESNIVQLHSGSGSVIVAVAIGRILSMLLIGMMMSQSKSMAQSGGSGTNHIANYRFNPGALKLLAVISSNSVVEGEYLEASVAFTNVGSEPIPVCTKCYPLYAEGETILTVDDWLGGEPPIAQTYLNSIKVLYPGKSISFPCSICIYHKSTNFILNIKVRYEANYRTNGNTFSYAGTNIWSGAIESDPVWIKVDQPSR